MNRLTRLLVASGAGLILALTASPASAAPPSESGSNGAQVEHSKSSSPYGTSKFHTVAQQLGDSYTINNREQQTLDTGSLQYSSDWKTHETARGNMTKFSSHNTLTENGVTCRMNSLEIVANGETRRDTEEICDIG